MLKEQDIVSVKFALLSMMRLPMNFARSHYYIRSQTLLQTRVNDICHPSHHETRVTILEKKAETADKTWCGRSERKPGAHLERKKWKKTRCTLMNDKSMESQNSSLVFLWLVQVGPFFLNYLTFMLSSNMVKSYLSCLTLLFKNSVKESVTQVITNNIFPCVYVNLMLEDYKELFCGHE